MTRGLGGAFRIATAAVWALALGLIARDARAVYACGGQQDTCPCGANNPYPCCDNGSNCTWWAWHQACCNWDVALPGWGNANTWASYASKNGAYEVIGFPVVGSIATSTKGTYGHVAWVVGVGNGTVTVSEMNCCGTCGWGTGTKTYNTSYFNSGFVVRKGQVPPPGPVCGAGGCQGGENCANCPQDCGNCCGNGACDWGEHCASCPQDCGNCCGNGACDWGEHCGSCSADCPCMPEGALGFVDCFQATGWAKDSNGGAPQVRVYVDEILIGTAAAAGPHPGHEGQGFTVAVPADFRDGLMHSARAEAIDPQTGAVVGLGPLPFTCRGDSFEQGLWSHAFSDSAGVEIEVGDAATALGVSHVHPGGLPYPSGGDVASCATLALEPFDELRAHLGWDFVSGHFSAELRIDAQVASSLSGSAAPTIDRAFLTAGTGVCLFTRAAQSAVATTSEHVELSQLRMRHGNIWTQYSADAAGIMPRFVGSDALAFEARAQGSATVRAAGSVTASISSARPFRGVRWTTKRQGEGPLPVVRADGNALISVGPAGGTARTAASHMLTLAFEAPEQGVEVSSDYRVDVSELRLTDYGTDAVGAWQVERLGSWNLDASPEKAQGAPLGYPLRLSRESGPGWATGALVAQLPAETGAERVRGVVEWDTPDSYLQLTAETSAGALWTLPSAKAGAQTFDLAVKHQPWHFRLEVTKDRPAPEPAFVVVRHLELLREGWWSTASADALALLDSRLPNGIRLGTDANARRLGAVPRGACRARSHLSQPHDAIRFVYRVSPPSRALAAELRIDGVRFWLDSVQAEFEPLELELDPFEEVGFQIAVLGDAQDALDSVLEAVDVEVRDALGVWRPIHAVQVTPPAPPEGAVVTENELPVDPSEPREPPATGGDGSAASEEPVAYRAPSGGCATGGRAGGTLFVFVLAFAGIAGCQRRARGGAKDHSPAPPEARPLRSAE